MSETARGSASGGAATDCEDGVTLHAMKLHIKRLNSQVKEKETEFGLSRAKFIELYKDVEKENHAIQAQCRALKKSSMKAEGDLTRARYELSEEKSRHTAALLEKTGQLEGVKARYQEEVGGLHTSYQLLMKEAAEQAAVGLAVKVKKEQSRMEKRLKAVTSELALFKARASVSEPSRSNGTMTPVTEEERLMEENMKRAKTQADHLKLVIEPYESEITQLKRQVDACSDQSLQIKELAKDLKTEKSARKDLELFVALLTEQKTSQANEMEQVRRELRESLSLLDNERKEKEQLKETWSAANDQFLLSQRLYMIDLHRMESVLTEEQQRRVAELQQKDEAREARQKIVDELETQKREREEEAEQLLLAENLLRPSSSSSSLASTNSERIFSRIGVSNIPGVGGDYYSEFSGISSSDNLSFQMESSDRSKTDTPDISIGLSEDQLRAITAPQEEDLQNRKLLEALKSGTAGSDSHGLLLGSSGRRVVSDAEWDNLQSELQLSRARVGRPCDMCSNYESQLQRSQEKEMQLEEGLKQSRQNVTSQKRTVDDLEARLEDVGTKNAARLKDLQTKVTNSETEIETITQEYSELEATFKTSLLELKEEREIMSKKIDSLLSENDGLMAKHGKHSSELSEATISLPNNLQESHEQLLMCREELIGARVSLERSEEQHVEECLSLKAAIDSSQEERMEMEGKYTSQINYLQTKLARLLSMETAMQREAEVRKGLEGEQDSIRAKLGEAHRQVTEGRKAFIGLAQEKDVLTETCKKLREKIRTLQVDLETGETVQRDFVKLSQSLQVQLEKLRQSENEVRWQHVDDVTHCNGCTQELGPTSGRTRAASHQSSTSPSTAASSQQAPGAQANYKYNCHHCGRVFCGPCTVKSVCSGPKNRSHRVCDVCHTILVKDATPFFSSP